MSLATHLVLLDPFALRGYAYRVFQIWNAVIPADLNDRLLDVIEILDNIAGRRYD